MQTSFEHCWKADLNWLSRGEWEKSCSISGSMLMLVLLGSLKILVRVIVMQGIKSGKVSTALLVEFPDHQD